jgi:hypothetical protein
MIEYPDWFIKYMEQQYLMRELPKKIKEVKKDMAEFQKDWEKYKKEE